MPRVRSSVWSGFRVDAAPLPPDDAATIRRYVAIRRLAHPSIAGRDERFIVRWRCWLAERGRVFGEATEDDAVAFAGEWVPSWGWSVSSVRQGMTALRLFHAWLQDHGHAGANPWSRVRPPREVVHAPRVLSRSEIDGMLEVLRRPHWRDVRDRAILSLLWAGGLRIGELIGLDVGDVDLAHERVTVMGKGSRERHQPIEAAACDALRLYLRASRPVLAHSAQQQALFLGRHGRRIDPDVVRDGLRRAASRAGIDRHLWPHLLRHTYATDLLEHDVDLRVVQELMGHANIRSTVRYTHVAQARIRAEYARARSRP